MTNHERRTIRFELDRIFERPGSGDSRRFDDKVDDFIKVLEKMWPQPPANTDPLGADRARRSLHQSGIGAPPDFGRSSA